MEGAVTVATADVQQEHFGAIRPLLDQIEKRKCLIITPLPHYVLSGCCSNMQHCTNIKEPQYKSNMLLALAELTKNLKNYLFYIGKKNIKVMDPAVDLRGLTDKEIWSEEDPIHMRPEMYSLLAEGVNKMAAEADPKRRREDHSGDVQPEARRGHHEATTSRERDGSSRGRGSWPRDTWQSYRGSWTGRRHIRGATRGAASGGRLRPYRGRGGAY
jgi:hypothetical protein